MEESTAKISQMLARGPTLKMQCPYERQLKASNISNTVIMVKAIVWALTSPLRTIKEAAVAYLEALVKGGESLPPEPADEE
jgi:hypothetical protein